MTKTRSIREVCRESVGIDVQAEKAQQATTARGPGGTMLPPGLLPGGQGQGRPVREVVEESVGIGKAAVKPQPTAPDLSGLETTLLGLAQLIAMADRAIDRLDQQPVAKAQVAPNPQPTTWGQPQRIPLPKTGPVATSNVPTKATVQYHAPTSPMGMAAATLAGPDPTITWSQPTRRGPTIRALVKRSLGMRY